LHTQSEELDAPGVVLMKGPQLWHVALELAPVAEEKVPEGQDWHTDSELAPLTLENLPEPHGTQLASVVDRVVVE